MVNKAEAKVQASKDKLLDAKNIHYPFWFGGSASCFAAMVTHPLDLGTYPVSPNYVESWLTII